MKHSVGIVVFGLSVLLGFSNTYAKVSQEEADQLKNGPLTPMGAEKAGNADGSIPAWTGKILGAPEWVNYKGPGNFYPDAYADEKPLFIVTAENYQDHKEFLTDGMIALFEKFPETFKLPVYPSHRDFRYNDLTHQKTYENALNAESIEKDGLFGVTGAHIGAPFPIPKNGAEVIWNHTVYIRLWSWKASYTQAAVFNNGNKAWGRYEDVLRAPYLDPTLSLDEFLKADLNAYFVRKTLEPARERGEVILVHEYLNQAVNPRRAWAYLPGPRRVRQAPTVGYDNPSGVGGVRTDDQRQNFNGSLDRYDWKLLGKRELYIPYHTFKLNGPEVSYESLATINHPNMDHFRFEKHRVWVVEANLREGKRHIFAKRMLYVDEDTWIAHLTDQYDGHGELWRPGWMTSLAAYDMPGITNGLEVVFDLQEEAYVVDRMWNEEGSPWTVVEPPKPASYFSPQNLRKIGK